MQQYRDQLQELGVSVLAVTFEQPEQAQAYVRQTQLPWPMLIDVERTLYAAYDMHAGRWRDLLGPRSMGAYARLMLRGRLPRRPTGDVRQLGGDVLVDPEGIVRLHHVGNSPADRPKVAEILQAVQRFSSESH